MKTTDQTLIEQLKITQREIERRKSYLNFSEKDVQLLVSLRDLISDNIDLLVDGFYQKILPFDEMDRIIGDAETLRRLKNHQRQYILNLFDGEYDEEYVHSRLRVGVVHKRIGLDPKYYVAAVHSLNSVLNDIIISNQEGDCKICGDSIAAVDKILMFDLSLAFDTYIYSLMDEVNRSKNELEKYTESLEKVISERTKLLKKQARYDGLTGLLNQHSFYQELKRELLRGQRQNYSTVLIYFDLDNFKKLNDTEGHKAGDEVLKLVAQAVRKTLRENDLAARYGGDEFCIILPESSISEGKRVCERLWQNIEEKIKNTGVTCSMGIAISTPDYKIDVNSLVRLADKAMYQAKKDEGFSVVSA